MLVVQAPYYADVLCTVETGRKCSLWSHHHFGCMASAVNALIKSQKTGLIGYLSIVWKIKIISGIYIAGY